MWENSIFRGNLDETCTIMRSKKFNDSSHYRFFECVVESRFLQSILKKFDMSQKCLQFIWLTQIGFIKKFETIGVCNRLIS